MDRHVSRDAVLSFKFQALGSVAGIARAIAAFESLLGEAEAHEVVAGVTLLAGGLGQTANPPRTPARLSTERPGLGHAVVDLPVELAR
ncbi:hypothetical protein [Streptomyces sp. 8L]|uniref:hypothetical protein n=1 Tax=Streptomyces sp. 8L TaxID=2877242 RepID=UPI001CD46023|nr:hypothetical protein [Streptomyces sp. 8L]MCA1220775.1 hypothetical protein [Streptomyces sp. 8L]